MKKYVTNLVLGLVGGALAFTGLYSFVPAPVSPTSTPATPVPTPTPTPSPGFWQRIVSDHALSTVAIQAFNNNRIVREGSGVIISADGVIVTTNDVVSGGDMWQVANGDKVLRASLVYWERARNLAILKVSETNLNVTRFDKNFAFSAGQEMIISGKVMDATKPTPFAQRAMVSKVLSSGVALDTDVRPFVSGARVINNAGQVVGIAYLRENEVRIISASTIEDYINEYFASLK